MPIRSSRSTPPGCWASRSRPSRAERTPPESRAGGEQGQGRAGRASRPCGPSAAAGSLPALGRDPLVGDDRVGDAWLTLVGDLVDLGGVLAGVVLRVPVVGEQVVPEEMPTRPPETRDAALAGVEHRL